jgi:molybdenum-dependent DNA-binding transcriptional regulator ModE
MLAKASEAAPAARECTMIDWDDVRYFLAVARGGSVRAAAKELGVNHATVLRRIAPLEDRLGTQMFEKLPSGYRLTAAGEEVLELRIRCKPRHTNWKRASSGAIRGCAGFYG